jgi:hypothetical protein
MYSNAKKRSYTSESINLRKSRGFIKVQKKTVYVQRIGAIACILLFVFFHVK